MPKYTLIDAQAMGKAHPATFEAPTPEELAGLARYDYVKFCFNDAERMWVKIDEKDGDYFTGFLGNDPVCVSLKAGDVIRFEARHVYDFIKGTLA